MGFSSVIINVNVKTIGINGNYSNDYYETIIDYVLEPQKNYVNMTYIYYIDKDKENQKKLNNIEYEKFLIELEKVYTDVEKNPNKYEKMTNSNMKIYNKLSMERIYQYFIKAIILNSKFIY